LDYTTTQKEYVSAIFTALLPTDMMGTQW